MLLLLLLLLLLLFCCCYFAVVVVVVVAEPMDSLGKLSWDTHTYLQVTLQFSMCVGTYVRTCVCVCVCVCGCVCVHALDTVITVTTTKTVLMNRQHCWGKQCGNANPLGNSIYVSTHHANVHVHIW